MKKLLLTFLIAFITALGLNAKDYYTIQFNSSYRDPSVTSYTDSWTATRDGKKWNLANFNNNNYQDYWAYIKCGRKKSASVATFSSDAALPEKISTVTVTIDKITVESVNSISLTVADDAQFKTNAATYTAANLATGDLPFTIDKPAANKFYKLTFDCKKSSNGVIQVSKFVFSGNDDLPTSCEAPTFNFEENAEVTTGDVIKATCTTDNSTVYLKVGVGEFEQTDSCTITKSLATGPLKFEAYATVKGANGIIESDHTSLNVNVVKKLGDIKYNGEAVPDTISLKGGETLTFTSANAVSMTLVVNGDEANKITTLDTGEILWTVPAATEAADQTYALSITSKLDDAVKTANTTVTVPTVETFELLTDLSDVNEENTYILFGTAESNPDLNQHLMNTTVNKFFGTLDINDSYITISKDKSIIEIPPTTTGVAYITLEKTTTEGSYKLKVGEQYIKFVKEKNVALTETKADGNDFTISFDTTKNNSIQIKSGNYILAYNASNPRFTSYGVSTNFGRQHLYVKKAAPSVKVPGDVTSEPAAVEGVITINKNDEITFSSKDAAKLQVSTQSGPVVVVGSPYKYTPTEEGEVTITPIDSEGKVYTEKAATFTIKFFVAPEAPTFTPNGGDVDLYSTVTIACATEGATLTYKIGDGEATAYPADGIKMTKAGEVTITAIATKNGLSTETTKIFNVTDKRREVYVRFDANKYEFTVGEEFESPVAKACTYNNGHFVEIPNFTGTIIYESDNTSVAVVNATTGALTLNAAGTCNITASLESETYKSDPAHYTLKVNKGLVDGLIEYPVSEFVYTIGSGEQLPVLNKYPDNVDVEYSISHERVENGVAVYNPATIDEQGNITVNTPGIVTVTATVKADRNKTASYVLEIQSLKEAEIAGTGSATPTGNVYTKVVNDNDPDLYENGHLYAILSYHDGKVYAMTPEDAGPNEGLKAVVIKEGVTGFEEEYTIDNSAVAKMLFDLSTLCLTYNDNGTLKYLVSPSDRHMQLTAETPTESHSFAYSTYNGPNSASLKIDNLPLYCNPSQLYFNTFEASNSQLGTYLFNCFLYKVGTAMSSASTVKAPVVHITGGNVYYSLEGEWYWGTEDESHKLSFANETDGAQIYYTMTSATPSSANVRAMANSATGTLYSKPFKKSDLDGKKITFWAEKDGQKSAVETLNFNIKTGIEDIDVENAEAIEEEGDARYFNLQGLEVKNPGEGIYIRVANGKATKILKK